MRYDFSNKQVAYFVTAVGNKPEKALKNMKETVAIRQLSGELGISRASEDKIQIEYQVRDWCNQIHMALG